MMKILFLAPNPHLPGGVSNFVGLLRKQLEREEFKTQWFFVGKTGVPSKDVLYPLYLCSQMLQLKKMLKEFQPDVVHINPSLASTAIFRDFLFLHIIKKEGYPVVFFIHGWQEKMYSLFQTGVLKNFFRKKFDMADNIIVLAEDFKGKLVSLGVDSKKIFVSTTMVDSTEFVQGTKEFSRPYEVLFCSTMTSAKGPYELLYAIPFVLEKYSDTSFTFVGDGKELKKLKQKAKEMGIERNVFFTGYKTGSEKTSFFKNAHVFVFPSHSEGFPTVVLEAMAAGTPLVLTRVGGLVTTIQEGIQGLFLEKTPADPRDIAQKILSLFENPMLLRKMSENNRKESVERYDTTIVTKVLIERYKELYGKKNSFK